MTVLRRQLRLLWRVALADLCRWIRVPSLIAATLIPAAGMGLTVLGLSFAVGRQPVAPNPYPVGLVEKDLRRGDTEFLDYQLVPVLALLALTTGALVTALAIAGDRESGVLRIMALTPASRAGLVLGRLIGGALAS